MTDNIQCQIITWENLYGLIHQLSDQIRASGYQIDLIVAIGRGGYIPGRILSDMLGIKDLTSFKIEHYLDIQATKAATVKYPLTADVENKNILLVDDVTDTGDTFDVALDHIRKCGAVKEIRTAVIIHKIICQYLPGYYADKMTDWRWLVFPWAMNEDLSALIGQMEPCPTNTGKIQEQLLKDHRIEVSLQQIENALILVKR